ncbi:MAG: calcium/proton exchanger [Chloroflexi bacterium]|nr:calcium/proton exchanger [Chloroflexota bacterium]
MTLSLNYLLVFIPMAILGSILGWNPALNFVTGSIAVIPLAGLIGESTEVLAARTGPKVGGLLNATLGNAAELIITIVAIRAGLIELVKASITGSILGNLLLVMGMSMLGGGLKNGTQRFSRARAGMNATMLILAVIAICVPALFAHALGTTASPQIEELSLGVSGVMIVLYALGIVYSFRAADSPLVRPSAEAVEPHRSLRWALVVMAFSTIATVWLSEIIVHSVESVVQQFHLTEFFLGIVLIPIIGNVAEHMVGLQVALKDNMDLSLEISVGSSLQIAMFVAPLLVFVSLFFGHELNLVFNRFELIALVAGVLVASLVSADGESNWLEGAQLLAVYVILGLGFFFLPA